MKKRIGIVALSMLALLAGLVWVVARSQRNTIVAISGTVPLRPLQVPENEPVVVATLPSTQSTAPAPSPTTNQIVPVPETDPTRHVAKPGETVSGLAETLLGKDTPSNRNAIINANDSLKPDPDMLIAGKSYRIPSAAEAAATPADDTAPKLAAVQSGPRNSDANEPEPATELKYTAVAGDTLSNLAHAFLGSGNRVHQDAIVDANSSLKADRDKVVAGKAYRIPAPNGLSAGANPDKVEPTSRPAAEPDSDDVIASNATRSLRYTARPGDTVTVMAIQLLGSDTQETRDAIINNNPSLKLHPDRVIAGKTYWIPAPTPVE